MNNVFILFLDSIIPLQLFKVKKLAQPKANAWTLRYITMFTLSLALATFITLFISQSSSFTNETSIKVTDISDKEWTCSMASVVTQSVTLNSTSEPNQYYNLMNINELKTDCQASLHKTDPCSNETAYLFSSGTTSATASIQVMSVTPAAATSNNVYYFAAPVISSNNPLMSLETYKYDVTSGILTKGALGGSIFPYNYLQSMQMFVPCSTAMDRNGDGIFLVFFEDGYSLMYFNGHYADLTEISVNSLSDSVLLTNDNHHNVYVLTSTMNVDVSGVYDHKLYYFRSAIIANQQLVKLVEFQTYNNLTITQIAIYCTVESALPTSIPSIDTLYIYYLLSDFYYGDVHLYHNGSSTLLLPSSDYLWLTNIQISGLHNKVFVTEYSVYNEGLDTLASVTSKGMVEHFNGSLVSIGGTFSMVQNETQFIYTCVDENYILRMHDLINTAGTSDYPLLTGFASSITGWFVCGDILQTTVLPTNIYSSACSNGISWQLEFSDTYVTTKPLFAENALTYAMSQCNSSLYDTICDRVGSLPPYLCTRKVYLPFFTVFATAITNARLLATFLFIGFGVVLGKMKTKDEKIEESTTTIEVEMSPMDTIKADT